MNGDGGASAEQVPTANAKPGWVRVAEVGSGWALRGGTAILSAVGERSRAGGLWIAALYFALRSRTARTSSRQYLERVHARIGDAGLGGAPDFRRTLAHLQAFGLAIFDRVMLWGGAIDDMDIRKDRVEEFFEVARQGRGALLLGAHVGSIDMLWFLSREFDLRVNVVVFYQNAERINAFMQAQRPGLKLRAIELDPDSVHAAFEIKACLDRGEFVVMLADRVPPGRAGRSFEAPFLGETARFPLGPFRLASVLRAPVLMTACLREGPRRYDSVLRVLSPGERVPRSERDKWAEEMLLRYVAELESICERHPLQWFNFYDFWDGSAP